MKALHSMVIWSYPKPSTSIALSSGRSLALIPPLVYRTRLPPRPITRSTVVHDQHSPNLPRRGEDQDSIYASYSSTSRAASSSTCGSASSRPFRLESRTPSSPSVTAGQISCSGTSHVLMNTTDTPLPPKAQTKMAIRNRSRLLTGSPLSAQKRSRTIRPKATRPALCEEHHHLSLLRTLACSRQAGPSRQRARRGNMLWMTPWRC